MSTGIHQYFSLTMWLSSHKNTGIGAVATREANGTMKHVLEKQASQQSTKKWKRYTNFSDTDRSEITWYAAIIVTASVLVKTDHEGGAKIGTAHSQI